MPEWLHEYGNVFSKNKSEKMPIWKPYDYMIVSQLYCGPVVTYCIVYYYTKRTTLARLLANKGPAIYVVL